MIFNSKEPVISHGRYISNHQNNGTNDSYYRDSKTFSFRWEMGSHMGEHAGRKAE